ncbi:MAG: lysylphosphatidylglycerol synthase transmembrane domain-containing protein, partial [bacterium]|nr:lysylphosphatidylglycerol synthase transmembrane domain-containing protein [bacterium]
LIGHAGNIIFPAHLGEIIRVYFLRNKTSIPASAALATIVTERLIDIVFLLAILFLSVFQFDFPDWVKTSGYLMLGLTIIAMIFIILLKTKTESTLILFRRVLIFFPEKLRSRIFLLVSSFLSGFVPLNRTIHYLAAFMLSVLIWATHLLSFVFGFLAFDFQLPWIASFVLIVITTISVAFPITPGFVGSYHLLCQFSLSLFGIAKGPALGFALVIHGINTLPFLLIGLALAWKEGVNFILASKRNSLNDNYSETNEKVLQ